MITWKALRNRSSGHPSVIFAGRFTALTHCH